MNMKTFWLIVAFIIAVMFGGAIATIKADNDGARYYAEILALEWERKSQYPVYELVAAGCRLDNAWAEKLAIDNETRIIRLPEVWDCTGTDYNSSMLIIGGYYESKPITTSGKYATPTETSIRFVEVDELTDIEHCYSFDDVPEDYDCGTGLSDCLTHVGVSRTWENEEVGPTTYSHTATSAICLAGDLIPIEEAIERSAVHE